MLSNNTINKCAHQHIRFSQMTSRISHSYAIVNYGYKIENQQQLHTIFYDIF